MTIPITPHPHTADEPCPGGCRDIDVVTDIVTKTKEELLEFEKRLQDNHDELLRFETRLDEGDTAEILSIMQETKAAFRVIVRLGDVIKWTAGLAAPLLALWWAFKDHVK